MHRCCLNMEEYYSLAVLLGHFGTKIAKALVLICSMVPTSDLHNVSYYL